MTGRWSPYHHHTMRQIVDNSVRIKRQLKPNTRPPHLAVKARTTQVTITQMTCRGTWTIEQDTQDRSTDCESMLRHATMATYSDVTNLATPEPKTANGLMQSYVAVWPNIEVPHTRFASLMK